MTKDILPLSTERKITDNPEMSYALTANFYTDPDIYEKEKQSIFHKNWIFACHIEKLSQPKSYFTFNFLDQNILLTRTKNLELKAFYNVCPHRGHELLKGEGKKSVIVCPYHAWTFHPDGRFIDGRGTKKVKDFDVNEHCLTPVRVEAYANLVFINLDPDEVPFSRLFNGLEADMRN